MVEGTAFELQNALLQSPRLFACVAAEEVSSSGESAEFSFAAVCSPRKKSSSLRSRGLSPSWEKGCRYRGGAGSSPQRRRHFEGLCRLCFFFLNNLNSLHGLFPYTDGSHQRERVLQRHERRTKPKGLGEFLGANLRAKKKASIRLSSRERPLTASSISEAWSSRSAPRGFRQRNDAHRRSLPQKRASS